MSLYYTDPKTYVDGEVVVAADLNLEKSAIDEAFTSVETAIAESGQGDWLANFRGNGFVNANMKVWNEGTSFPAVAHNQSLAERFTYRSTASSWVSEAELYVTGLDASPNGIALTTTTANAVGAGEASLIEYAVEGSELVRFWNRQGTFAFWCYASLGGDYSFRVQNNVDRNYITKITLPAGTWTRFFVPLRLDTVPGGGTWNFTNGIGLKVQWIVNAGTSLRTASTDTWLSGALTPAACATQASPGETLEAVFAVAQPWMLPYVVAEQASTSFPADPRTFAEDLRLTKRYYEKSYSMGTAAGTVTDAGCASMWASKDSISSGRGRGAVRYDAEKRTTSPTVAVYSPGTGTVAQLAGSGGDFAATVHAGTDTGFVVRPTADPPAAADHTWATFHWVSSDRLT